MEVIFEILFEIVFQAIFQFVSTSVVNLADSGLATVRVRRIVTGVVGVVVGFGVGWWWGDRLSDAGRVDPPRALYVSIALAAACLVGAVINTWRGAGEDDPPDGSDPELFVDVLRPWRWSGLRIMSYALMNSAAALGIAIGFVPDPLR